MAYTPRQIARLIRDYFLTYRNRRNVMTLAVLFVVAALTYGLLIFALATSNANWAGYAAVSNRTNPQPVVSAVYGSWLVQNTTNDTYSLASQWVGIGGLGEAFHDNSLIQIGTEYLPSNNIWNYTGWYELLPGLPVQIPRNTLTISANDIISASIAKTNLAKSKNTWIMTLNDITTDQNFTKIVNYNSSQLSADWIEESGIVGKRLVPLSNFKIAYFGVNYTGVNGTDYATIGNKTLPMGNFLLMPSYSFNYGGITAIVSNVSAENTSFKVYFKSSLGNITELVQVHYLTIIFIALAFILAVMSFYMTITKRNIYTPNDKARDELYAGWGRGRDLNLKETKAFLKKSLENELEILKASNNKQLARSFLKAAREDIKAAYWMNRFRNYGLAVFHLQQSIEKTAKAALLMEGISGKKSHNAIEVFEVWYSDIFRDTQIKASRGRNDFKTYNARISIAALTRTTQILISAIERQYEQNPELFNSLFESDNFKWRVGRVNSHLSRYLMDNTRQNKVRNFTSNEIFGLVNRISHISNADMAIELVPVFEELLESVEMLCALSILTTPHEQTSRYPGSVVYNRRLGIVRALPFLLGKIDTINKLWFELAKK